MSKRKIIEVKIINYSIYDIFEYASPENIIKKMEIISKAYSGRNIFFIIKEYDSRGDFALELLERRIETDDEYNKRLARETTNANKTKLKKEEKERKEYERLKKKFEIGDTQ